MRNLNFIARLLLALGCLVSYAHAQILRTVALEGTQAPGMDVGVNFSGFSLPPALNYAGETAFRGFFPFGSGGVTSSNNVSIWSEGGDAGLMLIAREGYPAAGTTENFSFLGPPVLNSAGQIAFFGLLPTGLGSNNSGIWSEGSSSTDLSLVARGGNPAPGIAGVNFGTFRDPVILSFVLRDIGATGVGDKAQFSSFSFGGATAIPEASTVLCWSLLAGVVMVRNLVVRRRRRVNFKVEEAA